MQEVILFLAIQCRTNFNKPDQLLFRTATLTNGLLNILASVVFQVSRCIKKKLISQTINRANINNFKSQLKEGENWKTNFSDFLDAICKLCSFTKFAKAI